MSEWETFCDVSYYHLWRVRRKTERGFDDGFHLESGEEARDLVELLNRMERERVEAQEDLEFRRGLCKVQEECLEAARRERSDAIRQFENLKATAIHTCHDQCQRPMCVLRRERDDLGKDLRREREAHNNTKRERDELREALVSERALADRLAENLKIACHAWNNPTEHPAITDWRQSRHE